MKENLLLILKNHDWLGLYIYAEPKILFLQIIFHTICKVKRTKGRKGILGTNKMALDVRVCYLLTRRTRTSHQNLSEGGVLEGWNLTHRLLMGFWLSSGGNDPCHKRNKNPTKFFFRPKIFSNQKWTSMKMIFGGIKQSFWTWGFLNCIAQRSYLNWSLTLKTKSCSIFLTI